MFLSLKFIVNHVYNYKRRFPGTKGSDKANPVDLKGSGSPPTGQAAPTDHTFRLAVCSTGSVSMPYDGRRVRLQAAVRFTNQGNTLEA